MPRILLIQPDPGQSISGGYRYNAEMAAHGAWELASVRAVDEASAMAADLVIADSIWLTERSALRFVQLAERGARVAFLMHSFPSMIAAAESGEALHGEPTSFEIETLERVGLVIAPGPHYEAMLRGRRVHVEVCQPGVADAWRRPPRRRRGACSLVGVGAVTPRKGFLDVLEALAGRGDDWRLTLVGSLHAHPPYATTVAEKAAGMGAVLLAGQVPPDEVAAIVGAADILVMPSYDENQPLVLLEATAASVPAVAYAAGAARQMVRHEHEGLVGPIGDKATLTRHLARLIGDETERFRMAEACWERQHTLPSWTAAAARARTALDALARG